MDFKKIGKGLGKGLGGVAVAALIALVGLAVGRKTEFLADTVAPIASDVATKSTDPTKAPDAPKAPPKAPTASKAPKAPAAPTIPQPTAAMVAQFRSNLQYERSAVDFGRQNRLNQGNTASDTMISAETALVATIDKLLKSGASPSLLVTVWQQEETLIRARRSLPRDAAVKAAETAALSAIEELLEKGPNRLRLKAWRSAMGTYWERSG